jgi:hypothetical protein
MRRLMISVICAGLVLVLNDITANAAKPKDKAKSKEAAAKSDKAVADSQQCKEVIITGTVTLEEKKDATGKVTGHVYSIVDAAKKAWNPPSNPKFRLDNFEGLKVKVACMQLGANLISTKSIEAVDKAAYDAKQLEKKAAAEKAAAERKAAAKK